jgi:hypothetical protein
MPPLDAPCGLESWGAPASSRRCATACIGAAPASLQARAGRAGPRRVAARGGGGAGRAGALGLCCLHVRTLSAENRLVCLLNRLVCLLNRLVCLFAIFACWFYPACWFHTGLLAISGLFGLCWQFSGLLAIPGGPMSNTLNDDAHPNPNPTRRTRARVPTRTHPCRRRPLNPVASPALRPTGSTCSGPRTCAAAPRRRRSARAPSSSKRGRCTGRPPCA